MWDFVEPLVRNDIRDADAAAEIRAELPSPDAAHSTTADYIRIATDRLC
ncbi:Uncharacterised protein [Mycolicibacterium gilvum]|uniref:DUF732 domain-containing protein n=1 Tax=Mycolicibacterium gilvum TaxID=1804 RepID=A0A378SW56_9MYCO|nr:Uncharacterised protein [Mycolicibacterium gilvum]